MKSTKKKIAAWLPRIHFPDFLWVTLSGILYVLCFPEWNFSPLVWVALLPWMMVLNRGLTLKATLVLTGWMSLLVGVGGFHWITFAMSEFGHVPFVLCLVALVLFSLAGQIQFYLYAILRKIFLERFHLKPGIIRLLLLALTYTACDAIVPKLFRDTFGHAFLGLSNIVQAADIGGVYGLTFLAALSNELICTLLTDSPRRDLRRRWLEVTVAILLLGGAEFYGWQRANELTAAISSPGHSFTIGAIQANIGDIDKIASETGNSAAADKIVDTYLALSEKALAQTPRPLALIWPETAYPALFRHPGSLGDMDRERRIESFVFKNKIPLLFGGYDSDGRKDFNSLFILSTEQYRVYHKNILLPFGEFIPIIGDFRWVERLFPQVGNFGRGPGPEAIPIQLADGRTVKFGPVICYEALFPWFTREAARQDNEVILNITNDSWFGPRTEPQLHLRLTVFRSIETRLAQIRATNTGITTLILPDGRLNGVGPIGEPAIQIWNVPILPPELTHSLFRAWGDWFGKFAGLLVLAFLIRHEYPHRRNNTKRKIA